MANPSGAGGERGIAAESLAFGVLFFQKILIFKLFLVSSFASHSILNYYKMCWCTSKACTL